MKLFISLLFQFFCLRLFLCANILLGQQKEAKIFSYQDFSNEIEQLELNEDESRFQKIDAYIAYAKLTQDPLTLWKSYDIARLYNKPELDTVYCDSMIWIAKKGLDSLKIADSYVAKALHLELKYKFKRALDALSQAEKYLSSSTNDLYVKNTIYYIKGLIYEEMNEGEKAKEFFLKSYQFFKKHHDYRNHTDYNLYYLLSVSHLSSIYAYLEKDSLSKAYNQELSQIVKNEKYQFHKDGIPLNAGINHFVQKRYDSAIIMLNQSLKNQVPNSGAHLTERYYIGLSYWHKNQKDKAIPYLLYIDSVYESAHKLPQTFRPTYERLIDYYHEKQDVEKQLEYVKKLLALDKSFESDYKHIIPQLEKKYSTQKLEEEKAYLENLLKEKEKSQNWILTIGFILIAILLFAGIWLYIKHKKINQKFQELTKQYEVHISTSTETENQEVLHKENIIDKVKKRNYSSDAAYLGMSDEVYTMIMNYLNDFEKNKGFLQSDLNQQKIAEEIGTNSTYLSKVINHIKKMSFSAYIHHLRINEATKNMYYNGYEGVPINKIAEKHGYTSEKTFVRKFKKINGMTPAQFLKRVKS